MSNLLIAGNSTMPRSVGIFNVTPITTCTPSPWCTRHCYACRGRFKWQPNLDATWARYMASIEPKFVDNMVDEIRRRQAIRKVRVHITGDFYSKVYVEKWAEIAGFLTGMIFRTNTKRTDLLPFMLKTLPENFVIRESTDPTRLGLGLCPTAAIVGTPGTDNHFLCCQDCAKCQFKCWYEKNISVRMRPLGV